MDYRGPAMNIHEQAALLAERFENMRSMVSPSATRAATGLRLAFQLGSGFAGALGIVGRSHESIEAISEAPASESWFERAAAACDLEQGGIELHERSLDSGVFRVALDAAGDALAGKQGR